MKDDGHEWQTKRGMALGCGDFLCTKWMRRVWECEGSVSEGVLIVVRNCGSERLNWDSEVRQE